jgi:hypothetical protein
MSWPCGTCGKHHLDFRKTCGDYLRCRECDEEALDFVHGLCGACYQRAHRRAKREARALIPCAGCGNSFKPARTDARYCSAACRQRAYRERQSVCELTGQ